MFAVITAKLTTLGEAELRRLREHNYVKPCVANNRVPLETAPAPFTNNLKTELTTVAVPTVVCNGYTAGRLFTTALLIYG
jgi:hypothetical protein